MTFHGLFWDCSSFSARALEDVFCTQFQYLALVSIFGRVNLGQEGVFS